MTSTTATKHPTTPLGLHVRFAGLVRMRQRPESAGGVTFKDEHGMVNAVV